MPLNLIWARVIYTDRQQHYFALPQAKRELDDTRYQRLPDRNVQGITVIVGQDLVHDIKRNVQGITVIVGEDLVHDINVCQIVMYKKSQSASVKTWW